MSDNAQSETGHVMTVERLGEFSKAWTAGDLEALMGFMADDCTYYASVGPEPGTTYRGREEVRQGFAAILAYDRGRERHDRPALIIGNTGVAEWSFAERDADGHEMVIRGCDIFEFAGDKIRTKDAFRKVLAEVPSVDGQPTSWNPAHQPDREAGTATVVSSPVTAIPHAGADSAACHFRDKLAYETDCADVWKAVEEGAVDFLIADCRPTPNYNKAHLPGAVSLPWQEINQDSVKSLPDLPVVTYCWGPSCNAATKGAQRLAALGHQAKEMIGGLEYWIREGHPTEGRRPVQRGQEGPSDWGLVV
jgi:rhodanese-related sulfurtransferase/ketosteroid isomerase-like protein